MAIDPLIKKETDVIRNEQWADKVRSSIANGLDYMSEDVVEIDNRQKSLESDFVAVQQDARSNTPSGAELAVAAGEYNTLGERLDAEEQKVAAQLAQKPSFNYVDAILMDIAKGGPNSGPQGPFMSIAALESYDFPDGREGTWLVFDSSFGDGAHSFMWDSTNSIWKDLGVYQGAETPEESITEGKLAPDSVTPSRIFGAEVINVLDLSNVEVGKELLSYSSSGGIYTQNNPNMAISGWKRVYPGEKYIVDKTSSAQSIVAEFRDSTNKYLSHVRPATAFQQNVVITIPVGAKHMRNSVVIQNRSIAEVMIAKGTTYPSKYYPFNSFKNPLFVAEDNSVTMEKLGGDVRDTINGLAKTAFSDTADRLLLHSDMYFIADEKLPIYKKSIVSTKNEDSFKTHLINAKADGTPVFKQFEDMELDPSELNDSFKIGLTSKDADNTEYIASINKHSVAKEANDGKTFKAMLIGDSLTENGTPNNVKSALSSFGVTTNLLGTFNNLEARSGWSYENFIGKSNVNASGSIITRSESGNTTRNENPFLKLATELDKNNHPDWCFRNTGSNNELSYASDTDKTGNFYIFDFAWYLSNHSIELPDVVTIALGTNDLMNSPVNESVEDCSLALEIMIKQIKSADEAIKIGVVPSTAWLDNSYINNRWTVRVANWIERCMKDVEGYQSVYSDLYIIPAWVHMSRKFIWNYDSQTDLSAQNDTQKSIIGDNLHYGSLGRKQYSNVMTAFLMNII